MIWPKLLSFFFYQSISIIIMINVKSLFLSSLKPEFCSKVKVVETRPLQYNKYKLIVTYTIIQSIMRSEMCSLHLTHPSVHTWSSGQPTVQRPGRSRGLPAGVGIRTHNLGLPRVSSPTLYPLGQRLPINFP